MILTVTLATFSKSRIKFDIGVFHQVRRHVTALMDGCLRLRRMLLVLMFVVSLKMNIYCQNTSRFRFNYRDCCSYLHANYNLLANADLVTISHYKPVSEWLGVGSADISFSLTLYESRDKPKIKYNNRPLIKSGTQTVSTGNVDFKRTSSRSGRETTSGDEMSWQPITRYICRGHPRLTVSSISCSWWEMGLLKWALYFVFGHFL